MNRQKYIRNLMECGVVMDIVTKKELAVQFGCSVHVIRNEIYRIKNPRYWDRNRETHQVATENGRARKLGIEGYIETAEWRALLAKYEYRCLACKAEVPLAMDHVIPLSKGGSHHIDNIQPLCTRCNLRKFDRTIDYR